MLNIKTKMFIGSQSVVGAKIADRLSEAGVYTITRKEFSAEMLEKSGAVLIDNTGDDIDEATERLILNGSEKVRTFVLTSDESPLISDKNGVMFISEKLGTENICGLLGYFFDAGNFRRKTEKAASKILMNIGFQVNLKGYRYLIAMILTIVENPELIYSFTHEIYPMIAEKYGVTALSVERATRNSIELAYDRNYQKFEELFGYKLQKPTNTEFVSFCAEKIRLELF